jgi:hypothetical protein
MAISAKRRSWMSRNAITEYDQLWPKIFNHRQLFECSFKFESIENLWKSFRVGEIFWHTLLSHLILNSRSAQAFNTHAHSEGGSPVMAWCHLESPSAHWFAMSSRHCFADRPPHSIASRCGFATPSDPASRYRLPNIVFPNHLLSPPLCCHRPDEQSMLGGNVSLGCFSECGTRELWAASLAIKLMKCLFLLLEWRDIRG